MGTAAGPFGLAIANHTQRTLTVRALDGALRTVAAPVQPHAHGLAAADLDGDGAVDLVLNDMMGRRAVILWGPDFAGATGLSSGSAGHACVNVAAADLDGDGRPDLAVGDWPRSERTSTATASPTSRSATLASRR